MDIIKCIRIVNVAQSLIEIDISWNERKNYEYFTLQHSKMLHFDCGEFGIPYSSLVTVEIRNGSETIKKEFTYSSRSIEKGQVVVHPRSAAIIEDEDDYGQLRAIKRISINNDLPDGVKVLLSWNSGKREFTLFNTSEMNLDCEEIPKDSRVDVDIVHPRKKAHLWFMHAPATEAAQLTLVDRGSGMLVYTQYQGN